ncbi:MAG: hypothetical protein HZA61_13675 [Candidatus Eisenbacteria bacterium]|uniref:Tetratricopeptide repeat protein n=1 Tax=Eiseniibacteriota bacterium TaxID=2212470 RepID=A0A933W9E3_UNCEI|nr:hypothetical protein [Candidatus Eisenbacteria bacterium]
MRLALHQMKSGRMPSGIQTLRRYCNDERSSDKRAERRRQCAALLRGHDQFEEALCHLSAALADGVANPVLRYKLLADQAAVLNGLGWHAEALEAAKHSMRIEPVHLDAIRERGIAHAGLGQALDAYRWLSMALENVYRDESALPALERLVETHGALLRTVYPKLHDHVRRLRRRPLPELSMLTERRRMQAPGTPDKVSRPNGPVLPEVMIEDLLEAGRIREAEVLADEHIAAAGNPTDALSRCCNAALAMSRWERRAEMDRYLNRMQAYEYEEPRLFAIMQGLVAQCLMAADREAEALLYARAAVEAYPLDEYSWQLIWELLGSREHPIEFFHAMRRGWIVMGSVNARESTLERWIAWKGPEAVRRLPFLDSYIAEFRAVMRTKRERYAEFVGKRFTFEEHEALAEAWETEGGRS